MRWRWPWQPVPVPGYRTLPGWPAAAAYPDDLADDLRRHLYASMYAVHPAERQRSRWAMSAEWFAEVLKLAVAPPLPGAEPVLLGLPVEVRDGAGVPHLEVRDGC